MMLDQDINQKFKIGFEKIKWLAVFVLMTVTFIFFIPLHANAGDACQVFLNGMQAHGSSGNIEFKYDAQLRAGSSSILATKTVKNTTSSNKKSCESVFCGASGNASAKFQNITFKASSSNTNINVPWNGNLTLGADGVSDYGKVTLASSSTLSFSPQVTTYKLKELSLAFNAIVNMPAGDYWIEKLKISSSSYIRVQGAGTVRLFVKEDLDLASSATFNENTADASKLIVYAYGQTSLKSYAQIYGLVYALGEGKLAYASAVHGAVSASKIQLDTDSFVVYKSDAAGKANFGEICQQSDTVPPLLTINPLPAETENNQISITGTVNDPVQAGSGIASVVIKLANGTQQPATISGSNYSATIALALGNNNFIVEAKDLSSNTTTLNGQIKRISYPELTVISPQDNTVVFQPVISVQGEVKTAWPAAQTSVQVNNQNQTLQTISAGVYQFTSANLSLALGSNEIRVNAVTPDGTREKILHVIYAKLDSDLDGYPDDIDAFPYDLSEWSDMDADGMGDNSDSDRDGDGHNNLEDAFPNNPAEWSDLDADGMGDNSDPDRDGDGHNNDVDKFPNDATEWSDLDNDGVGDNSDPDRDGDGYSNDQEISLGSNPNDPNSKPSDLDNDGIPDSLDDDRDGDAHNNDVDKFPNDATEWSDLDLDGIGDNTDPDRDGDDYSNAIEIAEGSDPNNAASKPQDIDNDGIPDSTDTDRDGDGHNNDVDAFPNDATEWSDLDADGIGDNSDPDRDGDGYANDQEIALGTNPNDANSKPADLDNDGIPDSLDQDRDGDGHNNDVDSFPNDATEWSDLDSDGIGDNTDTDRDGDGYSNAIEVSEGSDPNNAASKPQDIDNDGIPDSTDNDRDGDGHNNDVDAFPNDASEWSDLDGDGAGDNTDIDRDGDGYSNDQEIALGTNPNDANSKPSDLDNDGIPDALDEDRDGDGRNNNVDSFPNEATEWSDLDSDGIGDNTDTDRDGDGYSNAIEIAEGSDPNNAASKPQDIDNDGIPDSTDDDRDGDGHNNDVDAFPNDATEWTDLDADGIGDNSDSDRDGDGYSNDQEITLGTNPNDANSKPSDLDNDGIPDAVDEDRDGDGRNNDLDSFPNDATEWSDLDSDGMGDNTDTDRDGDGYSNAIEIAEGSDPNNAASKPQDIDNDGVPDSTDTDRDGDGHNNDVDVFPNDPTEWTDLDTDGIGDNTDTDRDGDGYSNDQEIALGTDPNNAASKPDDLDNDGIPDSLDPDRDGDGHNNDVDAFPNDATEWSDLDSDGTGDNTDTDRDGDGYSNDQEMALGTDPNNAASKPSDLDNDGIPDAQDEDRDGDGYNNDLDIFPNDASEWSDLDADGVGDNADTDRDGDGFTNVVEEQKNTDPNNAADYPDTHAPVLQLINSSGEQVNTSSLLLRINVMDVSQPHSGIASIKINNDRYPDVIIDAVAINNLVEQSIPLAIGLNTITITATDLSGNTARVIHQATRLAKANFVQISPADGSVVNSQTITISGQLESSRSSNDIRFFINEWQVTPDTTASPGLYQFSLPDVQLHLGQNIFLLRLETPDGVDERNLTITYQLEDPDSVPAPELSLVSPLNGAQINNASFLLKGRVVSHAGNVTVRINNQLVTAASTGTDTYYFESLLSFTGANSLPVNISATDALNKTTELTAIYYYDSQAPQISLHGLSASPSVNSLAQSPTQISGTVSDNNLASVTLNNQPIVLEPGAQAGVYTFSLPVSLQPAEQIAWIFSATDLSGNHTSVEYLFQSSSQISIAALLPIDNASLLLTGEPINLQVAARVSSVVDGYSVRVLLNNQTTPLTLAGTLASGDVTLPAQAGNYELQYQVVNNANEIVASTIRHIGVVSDQDIPVELVSYQPANGAVNIEPNQPLEFYFNKSIDLSLLQLTVRETLHGSTYVNLDESGTDFLSAKGYQLQEVHRDNELVSGSLSLLPGNQAVAFYPSRQFGFNAEVYVDLVYNGKTLARFNFNLRKLPTFATGGVVDQFGQPLAGISVRIPELNRTAITNGDGAFAFGFQEPAGQEIPGGQYQLIVNADLQNPRYGMRIHNINLQEGRRNETGIFRTTELHPGAPFQVISSGQTESSFVGDELKIDFSNARILFSTGSGVRTSGSVQFQFIPFDQLGVSSMPGVTPLWMYAAQPQGIRIEGPVSLNIKMPKLSGSYDYLNLFNSLPGDHYVVILGFDSAREIITPVGVGKIDNYRVISQGTLFLQSLDYIGYAIVKPELQPLLKQIAEGQKNLQELLIELQK